MKILVVCGPTAIGKTKLSIDLAKRYNGEIINGDSVQIYKGLDIGSAKIKEEEKEGIIHHLFDICNIDEIYTVADYQKDVRDKIKEIQSRGKTVIIVGGSLLYIKAALFDYTFEEEKENKEYNELSNEEILEILTKHDENININVNNRVRLTRALNFLENNNKSITTNNNGNTLLYDALFIGLTADRDALYSRINYRVAIMISDGLIDEVKSLYKDNKDSRILGNAIGYKEVIKYLDNEFTLEEAIDKIKQNSRRYAKRQFTFLNNSLEVNWFKSDLENFDNTVNEVCEFIDETL